MSTLSTQQIVEIACFGIVVVALGFMLNLLMGMSVFLVEARENARRFQDFVDFAYGRLDRAHGFRLHVYDVLAEAFPVETEKVINWDTPQLDV